MASETSREPIQKNVYGASRQPAVMRVHLRGNAGTLGDEVPPGAVSAVRGMRPDLKLTSATPDAERRRAMAGWIRTATIRYSTGSSSTGFGIGISGGDW